MNNQYFLLQTGNTKTPNIIDHKQVNGIRNSDVPIKEKGIWSPPLVTAPVIKKEDIKIKMKFTNTKSPIFTGLFNNLIALVFVLQNQMGSRI